MICMICMICIHKWVGEHVSAVTGHKKISLINMHESSSLKSWLQLGWHNLVSNFVIPLDEKTQVCAWSEVTEKVKVYVKLMLDWKHLDYTKIFFLAQTDRCRCQHRCGWWETTVNLDIPPHPKPQGRGGGHNYSWHTSWEHTSWRHNLNKISVFNCNLW